MSKFVQIFCDTMGNYHRGSFDRYLCHASPKGGKSAKMGYAWPASRGTWRGLGASPRGRRPVHAAEIIGFVLGSLIAAYAFKEFRATGGVRPYRPVRSWAFAMIGATLLGCPWRAAFALPARTGTLYIGLLGLIGGIWVGTLIFRAGYNLGRSQTTHTSVGWLLPLTMLGFLVPCSSFPR
jgi:hypothetical protein